MHNKRLGLLGAVQLYILHSNLHELFVIQKGNPELNCRTAGRKIFISFIKMPLNYNWITSRNTRRAISYFNRNFFYGMLLHILFSESNWVHRIRRIYSLRWRHNGLDSVSNHQPPGCLLNRLFRRKSKKTSKLRVTGLCAGNSPGTGEFSAQMASYAENVPIWWRHHDSVYRFVHKRQYPNP